MPRFYSSLFQNDKEQVQKNGYIKDCSEIEYILPDKATRQSLGLSPTLVSIIQFDIFDTKTEPHTNVIMTYVHEMHVSHNSVYLVGEVSASLPTWCPSFIGGCDDFIYSSGRMHSLIHRFSLSSTGAAYEYTTHVPGTPLTQYSMDENSDGDFRIITRRAEWSRNESHRSTELHIIAKNGNKLGSITDIAPGEDFQSSRFIGDRLYLVTFEQIDPFFVIDVSNSRFPKILGELKIPGYSTYLHPYDENRLIGL